MTVVDTTDIVQTDGDEARVWYEFAGEVGYTLGVPIGKISFLSIGPFHQRGYRFIVSAPGTLDAFVYHPKLDCWHYWMHQWRSSQP